MRRSLRHGRQLKRRSELCRDPPAGTLLSGAPLVLGPGPRGVFVATRRQTTRTTHFAVAQCLLAASASGTRCPCKPCRGRAALRCRTGCRRDISMGRRWPFPSSGLAGRRALHREKALAVPFVFVLPWGRQVRSSLTQGGPFP